MTLIRPLIAACLLGLPLALPPNAAAQGVPSYYMGGEGPTVLQPDPDTGRPIAPPWRPDLLAVPAVPVPHVMNGGGFGLTGNAYYNDSDSEGRLGGRRHPRVFVLVPAPVPPLVAR
ncbi:hypothetical protein U8607_07425 [Methylobacterium durans]|uniref:hypothetical protein n=1 Tax=Methylobacterium durans TaxID=2202825 RepID=UPI002AFE1DB9|nr:hypothetical protein [Methylobacterium durans]MEA1831913.1 hypothetical protein [Methylobacterium durans]